MRSSWGPGLLAFLFVAAAGCAVPAPPTGRIDGALLDPMMRPIGNTPVLLVELHREDETSALGGFTFRDLPSGNYTVAAAPPGMTGTYQRLTVSGNHISRVILQVAPTPQETGRIVTVGRGATWSFPAPGTQASLPPVLLPGSPDDIDTRVAWTGTLSPPPLEVQLWDNAGELLARGQGTGAVDLRGDVSRMANGTTALYVAVLFLADDAHALAPQPNVHLEATFDLYYGTTRVQTLGAP
ncbi:MAG: hypothetical protein ACYDBQ_11100 [Thermoplasmatota archaeon]